MDPACLLRKKRIQAFKTKCLRKLLHISCFEHKVSSLMRSKINFLVGYRNLFWQLSRDKKLLGLYMSYAMTASPKPSLRAPWGVGYAVIGRGNA